MKKVLLIMLVGLVGGGTLLLKDNRTIQYYKDYYTLNSQLKEVYSRSRELEKLGKYINIPSYKWNELKEKERYIKQQIKLTKESYKID